MSDQLHAQKVVRTYSKLEKRRRSPAEALGEAKRRKVEDVPPPTRTKPTPFSTLRAWLRSSSPSPSSSPSTLSTTGQHSGDALVFSDGPQPCPTPPSSPPPLLFSNPVGFRALKLSERGARTPITDNAINSAENLRKEPKPQLVQMQINLGLNPQRTCKECGMTYMKSNPEDDALHDKFHGRHLNGLDLGKPFRKFAEPRAVWRGRDDAMVVIVDTTDRAFERRKVEEVLDVVQGELGAVDIPGNDLWSVLDVKDVNLPEGQSRLGQSRYRAFLYMAGAKCVGLCLAKCISTGHRTLQSESSSDSISIADEISRADVGISRIWTSKSHRRNGIAGALLDTVARSFDPSGAVNKDRVAFSQPTTSGARLARRWYGQESGWLVYID